MVLGFFLQDKQLHNKRKNLLCLKTKEKFITNLKEIKREKHYTVICCELFYFEALPGTERKEY